VWITLLLLAVVVEALNEPEEVALVDCVQDQDL
jgi:hypothetical protein